MIKELFDDRDEEVKKKDARKKSVYNSLGASFKALVSPRGLPMGGEHSINRQAFGRPSMVREMSNAGGVSAMSKTASRKVATGLAGRASMIAINHPHANAKPGVGPWQPAGSKPAEKQEKQAHFGGNEKVKASGAASVPAFGRKHSADGSGGFGGARALGLLQAPPPPDRPVREQ